MPDPVAEILDCVEKVNGHPFGAWLDPNYCAVLAGALRELLALRDEARAYRMERMRAAGHRAPSDEDAQINFDLTMTLTEWGWMETDGGV